MGWGWFHGERQLQGSETLQSIVPGSTSPLSNTCTSKKSRLASKVAKAVDPSSQGVVQLELAIVLMFGPTAPNANSW